MKAPTLRQIYAAAALPAMIRLYQESDNMNEDMAVRYAFDWADRMLAFEEKEANNFDGMKGEWEAGEKE